MRHGFVLAPSRANLVGRTSAFIVLAACALVLTACGKSGPTKQQAADAMGHQFGFSNPIGADIEDMKCTKIAEGDFNCILLMNPDRLCDIQASANPEWGSPQNREQCKGIVGGQRHYRFIYLGGKWSGNDLN